jgi:short-subunit dehydrogenase
MNVIITGASRGLGRAVAERFAAHGHDLYLTSMSETGLYKTMESTIHNYPGISVKAKPFDLSKKINAQEFGKWVLKELEKKGTNHSVDILVNNAGQFLPGSVHDEEDGVLEKMIEINLYSAYHLTRMLLPRMIAQKGGHIFNMCSIASLQAYSNGGSYSISKFALAGFSKNLREEMKPHGVKVTSIYPGAAYTDSWAATGIESERLMSPGDIADMIYSASQLSVRACVEEIVLRPQLGDL